MSQTVFGAQAVVTMLNRAFNNTSPANAVFNNQVAAAGSTEASQTAFALQFGNSFAGLTDAQLSTRVLGNLGVLPNAELEAAVTQYFADNGLANRGLVVLQLGQILSTLETAPAPQNIFNDAAKAWNTEVEKSFVYSSSTSSTTPYVGDFAPTPVDQGQTFTLTVSGPTGKADNLTGSMGNDLFDARLPNSLETGDVLTDLGGTDTLDARIGVLGVTPTLTGIEKLYVQATAGASMNLSKATGYKELWNQDTNTGNDLTFNSVAAGTTIGLKNIARDGVSNSTTTVNFAAANATTNVVLDGAGTGAAGFAPQLILNSNATTVDVSTTGAASRLQDLGAANLAATASTLNTLKVGGTADLRVENAVMFSAANTTGTVDAAAFKGNLNINLSQAGRDLTVTGGEGADRFNLGGTLTTADNIKGGAGRDTLAVSSEATIVPSLNTDSLEIVEVVALSVGSTLNLARVNGADSAVITGFQGAAATISGLKSNGSVEFQGGSAAEVTATVTGATSAGTVDTLNVVLNHGGAGQAVGSLAIAGVENVNLSSVKQSTAFADATNTFIGFNATNAPQIENLTVTGNQNLNINGALNPQIKTVKAADFTGDLFVQVLGGVTNNGVAITGGSGDDRLVGGSSNDVIVTGEGSNTVRGDVLGVVQPGSPQASLITISGVVEVGDVFTATVNGTSVTYVAQVATVADVQAGLIAALNNVVAPGVTGNAGVAAAVTAAAGGAGQVVVTEDVNNGGFALSVNAANRQATPETSTLTVAAGTYDIGDTITTTVAGVGVTYTVLGTTQTQDQVAAGIAAAINASVGASPIVNATAATNVVTLVSDVAGTPFTLNAGIVNAAPTAATAALTPAGLGAGESVSVTIGGNTFTQVFNTDVSTTLANFVVSHGAAINALTGGTLSGRDTDNADFDFNPTTGTFEDLLITGAGTGAALTGGTITGTVIGTGSVAVTSTAGIQVTANAAPIPIETVTAVAQGTDNTQAVAQATTTAGVAQVLGAGGVDAITLGGGSDAVHLTNGDSGFLSAGVIQVDTWTGINFGGATSATRADVVDLFANGQQTGLVANNGDIAGAAAFGGFNVINGGVAQAAVAAPTLTAAVAAIFNAGGQLNGQVNAAGLFTYGSDTYLVIAGAAAGAYAGDDSVIKLVGHTGTLEATDFV